MNTFCLSALDMADWQSEGWLDTNGFAQGIYLGGALDGRMGREKVIKELT